MSNRGRTQEKTPVPLAKVALLGSILLANNASIWMIFSFLPFMVAFFYPELSTTELGFQSGILGSAFSAGSLIGNFVSGILSDRVGRRPALLWGLMGTAISSLCFGFSPTFWFAVASRFMWGVLNGNIGVAKTYLAEISDDTNLATGMAYFGVIGGLGRIIGPIIGGMLSYPANVFVVFKGTIFEVYPFALPSMIICVNCIIMFTITYIYLPETLNVKNIESNYNDGNNGSGSPGVTSRDGVKYSALLTSDSAESGNGSATDSDKDTDKNNYSDNSIELTAVQKNKMNSEINPLLTESALNDHKFSMLHMAGKRFSGETDEESEAGTGVEGSASVNSTSKSKNHHLHFASISKEGNGVILKDKGDIETGTSSLTPSPSPAPLPPRKGHRRNISFSSRVRVKVIDHPDISYQDLKQVSADEVPLLEGGHGNGTRADRSEGSPGLSEDDDSKSVDSSSLGESLIPVVRYSNGSEFFESVDSSHQSVWANLRYLLRQRHVSVATSLYGLAAFVVVIVNEIFTLWIVTSVSDGGLDYNTQQIGTAIMICGAFAIILQLTVYPTAVEKLGVLAVHRYGGLMFAVNSVFIPTLGIGAADRSPTATLALVVLVLTVQAVAVNWYLISTFVLISNSCYSHQLATVNGIGQTCASIGRLSGPYLGSVLFAWSETNGLEWPFNQYFVFYVSAILAVMIYQYSLYLPRSIQRRKREPKFRTWDEADEYLRRFQEQQQQQLNTNNASEAEHCGHARNTLQQV